LLLNVITKVQLLPLHFVTSSKYSSNGFDKKDKEDDLVDVEPIAIFAPLEISFKSIIEFG
jgi:hypothetical protein